MSRPLALACNASLSGLAGLTYWWLLAEVCAVPDAPHPLACIALGTIIGLYARWTRTLHHDR